MPRADDVPPSPAEAARTLREIDEITGRSRRVVHAAFTRAPLTSWGIAWLLGYSALDAAAARIAVPLHPLITFGVAAGGVMAVLGAFRMGAFRLRLSRTGESR